jgi:hypothetical protein
MRFRIGAAAGLLAVALAAQPSAQPAAQRNGNCLPARDLPQKTFQRVDGLDLKFAFVWVDDIQSNFVGGYDPFDLFVVVGRVYSPFEMASGKLERGAFERLSRPGRNLERFGPLTVPASFPPRQPPTLRFTSGSGRYQVRAIGVKPARFGGEDLVTIQVCRD